VFDGTINFSGLDRRDRTAASSTSTSRLPALKLEELSEEKKQQVTLMSPHPKGGSGGECDI